MTECFQIGNCRSAGDGSVNVAVAVAVADVVVVSAVVAVVAAAADGAVPAVYAFVGQDEFAQDGAIVYHSQSRKQKRNNEKAIYPN